LGYAEACGKLVAVAEQLKSRYQLEVTAQAGQVALSGKGLRGQVVAQKDTIDVEIELFGPLMLIKGRIAAGVRKALDEQFG
jgi:hypothetical protein